jgi:hypothetical protein
MVKEDWCRHMPRIAVTLEPCSREPRRSRHERSDTWRSAPSRTKSLVRARTKRPELVCVLSRRISHRFGAGNGPVLWSLAPSRYERGVRLPDLRGCRLEETAFRLRSSAVRSGNANHADAAGADAHRHESDSNVLSSHELKDSSSARLRARRRSCRPTPTLALTRGVRAARCCASDRVRLDFRSNESRLNTLQRPFLRRPAWACADCKTTLRFR